MKISDRGVELIKEFEGFSAVPYDDVGGKMTIGFGHLMKKDDEITPPISEEEAEEILLQDISYAESAVNQAVCVDLTQNQFDALVSFTFNLGGGNLLRSTLLEKLNDGLYKEAANQLLRWNKVGNLISAGLAKRRIAEKELFLT